MEYVRSSARRRATADVTHVGYPGREFDAVRPR
jgi:hypothetical protein